MEYDKTPRNKVNRLAKRAAYDYETVHRIIDSSPILHVAFNPVDDPDGFPAVLPMLGCTAAYTPGDDAQADSAPAATAVTTSSEPEPSSDPTAAAPGAFPTSDSDDTADPPDPSDDNDDPSGPRSIYLHGWVSARLLRSTPGGTGTRVCVSAAHVDGAVLALAPFHNSANYRSAVAYGLAQPVTDARERDFALRRITDGFARGRWARSRGPPTRAELAATGVLRVDVESASAKVRVGGPSEDRADLADDALAGATWTGVVPMYLAYGTPVPGPQNRVAAVPAYIERWRSERNAEAERYAVWAASAGENKK
ncbi:5-nitroimidazole antibiotic resistance protein [Ganoderma leucocontextum]|nr:5-nitroimidazole antibiotic resistance protein [Ganoderma leucocontextum]